MSVEYTIRDWPSLRAQVYALPASGSAVSLARHTLARPLGMKGVRVVLRTGVGLLGSPFLRWTVTHETAKPAPAPAGS